MSSVDVQHNLEEVHQEIQEVCDRTGRDHGAVKVVAVTKGFGVETVRRAREVGLRRIGENRVGESLEKMQALDHDDVAPVEWHMIGHLQSNKVRRIVGRFALIHSIDRLSVVQEMDKRYGREELAQTVLMQVNVSGEASKYGVDPDGAHELLEEMLNRETLTVAGLMTMAPLTDDTERLREVFAGCRKLRDRLASDFGVALPELSMGMTNDYRQALREGATILRLGRRLFGDRPD